MNHHATAFLKGKLSIISSSQESCFLTADGVDLNAPEGEREELYYFCQTARSHRHGQHKESSTKSSCISPENSSSLSRASLPSHVSKCERLRWLEPVCDMRTSLSLLFLALPVHPQSEHFYFFQSSWNLSPYINTQTVYPNPYSTELKKRGQTHSAGL